MEEFLIKAAQLILSLSILVVLHEFGHFLPAKLFGVRVERFYLFFNPWFSLFKFKRGETTYGIGWLPLGGYVKLSGMIDESMDKEQMKQEPQPWEFRSKPAWQRLIVMVGGVTVNLILGILIYSMTLFVWGKQYISANDALDGVHVSATAKEAGFRDGDRITELNGEPVPATYHYRTIAKELLLNEEIKSVTVVNEGEAREIPINEAFGRKVVGSGEKVLFSERMPFVADSILVGSNAEEAGLLKGDRFLEINGEPAAFFQDFSRLAQENKSEEVELTIERDGQEQIIQATVGENGTIGIKPQGMRSFYAVTQKEYSFAESFPAGWNEAMETIGGYIDQFKLVFTKEGISQVGGFGAIGSMFPPVWDWESFWRLTAFLSLILAFMNILPIPALDGGHVLFLLYEMVARRKPGEKFMEYAQFTGMLLLLTLLVLANGNDLLKLIQ